MRNYFKRNKECLAVIAMTAVVASVIMCGLMSGIMLIAR